MNTLDKDKLATMRASRLNASDRKVQQGSVVTQVDVGIACLNTVSHHKYLRCAKFVNPIVRQLSVERGNLSPISDRENNRNSMIVIDADAEETEREIALEHDVYEEKLESELEISLEDILHEEPVSDIGYESDNETSDSVGVSEPVAKQETEAFNNVVADLASKDNTGEFLDQSIDTVQINGSQTATGDNNTCGNKKIATAEVTNATEQVTVGTDDTEYTDEANDKVKEMTRLNGNTLYEPIDTNVESNQEGKTTNGTDSESDLLNEIYKELNKRSEDCASADDDIDGEIGDEDVWVRQTELDKEPINDDPDYKFSDTICRFKKKISASRDVLNTEFVEYNIDQASDKSDVNASEEKIEYEDKLSDQQSANNTSLPANCLEEKCGIPSDEDATSRETKHDLYECSGNEIDSSNYGMTDRVTKSDLFIVHVHSVKSGINDESLGSHLDKDNCDTKKEIVDKYKTQSNYVEVETENVSDEIISENTTELKAVHAVGTAHIQAESCEYTVIAAEVVDNDTNIDTISNDRAIDTVCEGATDTREAWDKVVKSNTYLEDITFIDASDSEVNTDLTYFAILTTPINALLSKITFTAKQLFYQKLTFRSYLASCHTQVLYLYNFRLGFLFLK